MMLVDVTSVNIMLVNMVSVAMILMNVSCVTKILVNVSSDHDTNECVQCDLDTIVFVSSMKMII